MKTFWLSFCDDTGFLGVSIVEVDEADVDAIALDLAERFPNHEEGAEWIAAAANKAWRLGCNPGGQMASIEIPDDEMDNLNNTPRHVLLQKPALEAMGHL